MSDSRLEKFIYAICSMDVSDLPVPLSRIEKLWNCLITGETPDFEPLSRNEKYLMAMLDRYDISNLPAPMSRGEKLLYKIAVGETDLSDVPGYLSRYEELLKYLIENGGNSESDFEYVLYTLNQSLYTLYTTAEKPVKSAILKGQTLVNVNRSNYTANTNITTDYGQAIEFYDADMLPNTTYTIIMYSDNPYECRFSQMYNDREHALGVVKVGTPFVFTTVGNHQGLRSYLKGDELNIPQGTEIKILIIEGDYTNIDIPYFEGMQSVKMHVLKTTGKNLFDDAFFKNTSWSKDTYATSDKYLLKPNTQYTLTLGKGVVPSGSWLRIGVVTSDGVIKRFLDYKNTSGVTDYIQTSKSIDFTTTDTGEIRFNCYYNKYEHDKLHELLVDIQIEEGLTATEYEPFKSNILSTPSDLELRGIGKGSSRVEDELDCLTGEVVERIGEVVLDGSDDEKYSINGSTTSDSLTRFLITSISDNKQKGNIICDLLPVVDNSNSYGIFSGVGLNMIVNCSTVNELRTWLQQNPITVQYELATESVKTVDLTVVDQDNQPTELGTFENVTHVSLEAENLIPEVEMEVATRISTELASASPLMNDISTEQQQLETTVDEQSNNVDATMIATTEIFEETL